MFGYKVDIESYCDHHEPATEQYGNWSSRYTNTMKDTVCKTNEYPDIVSSLDIPVGSRAFVVWVVWSTGDSFGRAAGSYSEAFGIFTDLESAEWLRTTLIIIREQDGKTELNTPDGQEFTLDYMPWYGYFESLDVVNVTSVTVA